MMNKFEQLIDTLETIKSDECMIWPYTKMPRGYGQVYFPESRKKELVHRVAFWHTHGRWPQGDTRHTCDTPSCFNPAHLLEGTRTDNVADMFARNRSGSVKIEKQAIQAIRAEYIPRKVTLHALAAKYGIKKSQVWNIVKGVSWKM
jgi:HNH endonuclease